MKAILPVLLLGSSLTLTPAQTDRLSSSGNARITETGPHHRVWTRTVEEPTPYGEARRVEHRYVEMATGLNYLEDGVWKESKEEIEINQGHAVARKGQHKVIFAGDIATPGAIDMEMPGGERATMHVLGLSFFDEASGQSVLIAEVKSSTGIVDGNTVVYMDAFTDVAADIRYTYTKAGLEQDILLTEGLPFTPEDFGMSSQTTVLQVLTEFATLPRVTQRVERIVQDDGREIQGEELDFGTMRMSRGDAFRFDAGRRDDRAVRVQKLLRKLDGRDFLIEQVPIRSIADELDRLPPRTGAVPSSGGKTIPRTASIDFKLPAAPKMITKAKAEPMMLARYKTPAKSFLLDYQTLNSTFTNVTLQADTTYYVSARTDLYGATTFEDTGQAVFRYTYDAGGRLSTRWTPEKGTTTYRYDPVGNLTNLDYPNSADLTLTYDAVNRLTNLVDAVGTTRYTWNAIGQLLSEDGPWSDDTVSLTYQNRLRTGLSVTQPNAAAWSQSYAYDAMKRLTNLASPAGSFGYGYGTPMSPSALVRILTLPGGNWITNELDSVGRVPASFVTSQVTGGNLKRQTAWRTNCPWKRGFVSCRHTRHEMA